MCGLALVYNSDDLIKELQIGLLSMEHRSGESAGIAISQPNPNFMVFRKNGPVYMLFDSIFGGEHSYPRCRSGIGHGRYSTIGKSDKSNIQPVKVKNIALGHNGTLVNDLELREQYRDRLRTELDSEIIAFIMHDTDDFLKGTKRCMDELQGAYNFVVMNNRGQLAAFRDPHGFHPLFVGNKNGRTYIASEDIALTKYQVYDSREMEPGEIIIFSNDGKITNEVLPQKKLSICSFELFYFLNYGSRLNGHVAKNVRRKAGHMLAAKYPVKNANLVIPNPDSGIQYAIGYSEQSSVPFDFSLANTAVGRTYTHPEGHQVDTPDELMITRSEKARRKLSPVVDDIRGKRIVITDDSIVRLVNARVVTDMLYEAGAKEVHWRVGYAPVRWPCFFGLRHSTRSELAAAKRESKEDIEAFMEEQTGASSIRFLTTEDNMEILGNRDDYCFACQNGEYPCEIPDNEKFRAAFA